MPKWEYLTVFASEGADHEVRPTWNNNKPVLNWESGPVIEDYLNTLGEEGWELVSERNAATSRWEYHVRWFEANFETEGVRDYLKMTYPTFSNPPKYLLEALEPALNTLGGLNWELVHMEPVAKVGQKHDILFTGEAGAWSNQYFCVFKRSIQTVQYLFKRLKS